MSNRAALLRRLAGIVLGASLLAAFRAHAEAPGPVYKDLERFDRPMIDGAGGRVAIDPSARHPARVVTGGSGYVGSDYGLGKPSFTGLGSRPDPFAPD